MMSPENRSELKLFGIKEIRDLKTLMDERSSTLDAVASTNFQMSRLTPKFSKYISGQRAHYRYVNISLGIAKIEG